MVIFCKFYVEYKAILFKFNSETKTSKHSINICTYNCENVKTSVESIHNVLCDSVNCDVILLQEHWLYPDDLHFLSTVHDDFNGFGVTPMSIDNKLLSGRPFGGVGFLWRKQLSNLCKPVLYDDPRVLGLEIQSSDFKILLLCVYLPYECDDHYDEFMHYLAKLKNIIDDADTPYVYIFGYFNSNIARSTVFGNEFSDFCNRHSFVLLIQFYLLIALPL